MKYLHLLFVLVFAACATTRTPPPRPLVADGTTVVLERVEFSRAAYTALRFLYKNVSGVEYVACLDGVMQKTTFVVTTVVIPWQVGNTWGAVQNHDCAGYPGYLHSHPVRQNTRYCYPSDVDTASFWRQKAFLMVIWCDKESFVWAVKRRDLRDKVLVGGWNRDPNRKSPVEPYMTRAIVGGK